MESTDFGNRRLGGLLGLGVILALVIAGAMASAIPGGAKESPGLALRANNRLWITGTSTVHAWHSKATSFQVSFAVDPAKWPSSSDATSIERAVASDLVDSVEVAVDVKSMRSGKDGLDKNMFKALKVAQHPRILCRISDYEAKVGAGGAMAITANAKLTVAGVERTIRITGDAVREGDGLRIKGSVPVHMTDFGIKPPVMMMGTIKTGNDVMVEFDLLVGASTASGI